MSDKCPQRQIMQADRDFAAMSVAQNPGIAFKTFAAPTAMTLGGPAYRAGSTFDGEPGKKMRFPSTSASSVTLPARVSTICWRSTALAIAWREVPGSCVPSQTSTWSPAAFNRATAQSAVIRAMTERYRVATLKTLRIAFASSAASMLMTSRPW